MSGYAVANTHEIAEQSDERCPRRSVRRHFGITSFGANAWTGKNVGTMPTRTSTRFATSRPSRN